jgi:hypothetical protein
MELHGIKIKPGMIIETRNYENSITSRRYWVAVPTKNASYPLVFINTHYGGWVTGFENETNIKVVSIREPSPTTNLYNGKILWEDGMLIVTKKEIAVKFGIEESKLKIVE